MIERPDQKIKLIDPGARMRKGNKLERRRNKK
jgi:hypothetical protein